MKRYLAFAAALLFLSACGPGHQTDASGENAAATEAATTAATPESSSISGATAHEVVLRSDTGDIATYYDCDAPRLGVLTKAQQPAIRDYVARMVRARRVPAGDSLKRMMAAYQAPDWSYMEAKAVADACENGALPPRRPVFPEPGTVAPDLAMQRLDGSGIVRVSDFRGDYVVIDFWATWCGPCIEEMPTLAAWARRSPDRLKVLAVLHNDNPGSARTWVTQHLGSEVKIIMITDVTGDIAQTYGVKSGIPVTLLLDRRGRVAPACDSCRYRAVFPNIQDILTRELGWETP